MSGPKCSKKKRSQLSVSNRRTQAGVLMTGAWTVMEYDRYTVTNKKFYMQQV